MCIMICIKICVDRATQIYGQLCYPEDKKWLNFILTGYDRDVYNIMATRVYDQTEHPVSQWTFDMLRREMLDVAKSM